MNRTVKGLDYSFARPNLDQVKAQGFHFVVRYLTGSGKALTGGEIAELRKRGLAVAVVFESSGNRAGQGRVAGEGDARQASGQAKVDGLEGIPIFMAVDFDATFAQVKPYFEGVSGVLGKGRRGAYASGLLLRQLVAAGLIDWAWEAGSTGWGDGRRYDNAHILQKAPSVKIGGADVDVNWADPSAYGAMRFVPPKPGPSRAVLKARLKLRQGQLARAEKRAAKRAAWIAYLKGRIAILTRELGQ